MSIAYRRSRQFIALIVVYALCIGTVSAGITVTGADGITATGADGITYIGTSGITATGADGFLAFTPNGITATGADGITATGADGITATGADGVTYTGTNGITATGADGITATGADGITATGADGITITGADGTTRRADSVIIRTPNGITATGADGITATGADGITATGADGITATGADGITITGADGITISGADGITATGADGQIFRVAPSGITITGADGITITGADGITISGADTIQRLLPSSFTLAGADSTPGGGIRSVDPELAIMLNQMTDDSNVNAVVVYHQPTTESDLADLRNLGVLSGTRYRNLPMITLTATRWQIFAISRLRSVRSIYGNRTLQTDIDPYLAMTGTERVRRDSDLTKKNLNVPVSGRNVTVAVLDTGVDGTHPDLLGRVVQNVKLADAQSASLGFMEPINVEGLPTTDQVSGHGTFVAGLIAGNGSKSSGKYGGVAPGARILGLSAGDMNLSYVLAGFDYLLGKAASLNVRVVNCSFSANTVFDLNDPINIATKMLTDRGVNVVFSAGNTGPGQHTLNPYAVAPWVISVGATDERGRLAEYSSRGDFGHQLFRPTLVAPGTNVVSLRSTGMSQTGTLGLKTDINRVSATELPYYTTATGTSFSAPQVAGTIALMLESNPALTPKQIRDILQRTATPLPAHYQHEVGAGMLNAHAAVLESSFQERRMGAWRATLDQGQVSFISEEAQQFSGKILDLSGTLQATVTVPQNTVLASVHSAWGPMLGLNDLALTVYDSGNTKLGESNAPSRSGLTGKRESVSVAMPAAGTWHINLSHATGNLGAEQSIAGLLEVTRVEYAALADVDALSASARSEIYQALRSFSMTPYGKHFRPTFGVTRSELAATLVRGARVPQYLPGKPSYTDVDDKMTMIFVESAQYNPSGALFADVTAGGKFEPDEYATRLVAAVALVRAAGLQAEADAAKSQPLNLTDANLIPLNLRGYVSVAISRRLLVADNNTFRSGSALTRAELAHAMSILLSAPPSQTTYLIPSNATAL